VCSAAIAASGFSALEFLAKRLGQMHQQGGGERGEGGRREDSDENLEEHEARQRELRELQVGSIRAMLLVGEKHPKVFSMLGQSLAKWLSPDLTSRGALRLLSFSWLLLPLAHLLQMTRSASFTILLCLPRFAPRICHPMPKAQHCLGPGKALSEADVCLLLCLPGQPKSTRVWSSR